MIPTAVDWNVLIFTLVISGGSVLLSLPFAVGLARWSARRKGIGVSLVETLITLPLALPPVAVGIFLLKLLSNDSPLGAVIHSLNWEIAFTWKGVLVSLFVMSFPLTYRPIRAAFDNLDPRFPRLSHSLGNSTLRTFFLIEIPLSRDGMIAGIFLGWARALGEFGCTIILAGNIIGETRTLSLAIFYRFQMGNDTAATRLALLTAVATIILVWISNRFRDETS